jgi:aldehyde dehydrogenase family 7 protein A1
MVSAGNNTLNFAKYPFLKELGLSEQNLGCYRNGEWVGRGTTVTSVNPHNNEKVATIKTASLEDYEECIKGMASEKVRW